MTPFIAKKVDSRYSIIFEKCSKEMNNDSKSTTFLVLLHMAKISVLLRTLSKTSKKQKQNMDKKPWKVRSRKRFFLFSPCAWLYNHIENLKTLFFFIPTSIDCAWLLIKLALNATKSSCNGRSVELISCICNMATSAWLFF